MSLSRISNGFGGGGGGGSGGNGGGGGGGRLSSKEFTSGLTVGCSCGSSAFGFSM